jgi:hypothetical protein
MESTQEGRFARKYLFVQKDGICRKQNAPQNCSPKHFYYITLTTSAAKEIQ